MSVRIAPNPPILRYLKINAPKPKIGRNAGHHYLPERRPQSAQGIEPEQAAELRAALATFEDWNAPEMDIYNDYDAAKDRLNVK